jgi:hypothetical protein
MLKTLVVALGTMAVISQAGLVLAANPDTARAAGWGNWPGRISRIRRTSPRK